MDIHARVASSLNGLKETMMTNSFKPERNVVSHVKVLCLVDCQECDCQVTVKPPNLLSYFFLMGEASLRTLCNVNNVLFFSSISFTPFTHTKRKNN